jgi:hypothetical protein
MEQLIRKLHPAQQVLEAGIITQGIVRRAVYPNPRLVGRGHLQTGT